MLDKVIDWLTEVVTGDEMISRGFLMGVMIITILISGYSMLKDSENRFDVVIGEESEQVDVSEL